MSDLVTKIEKAVAEWTRSFLNDPNNHSPIAAHIAAALAPSHEAGPITTEQLDKLQFRKVLHDRPHAVAGEQFGWVDIDGNFSVPKEMTREKFLALFGEHPLPIGKPCIAVYAAPASQDATRFVCPKCGTRGTTDGEASTIIGAENAR